jgi:multicomponent Na+:H+ antiporter subunit F
VSGFYLALAVCVWLTIAAGMVRVVRGPTAADRMLAAQLFGTTGVAVMVLLSQAWDAEALLDVALILALLAAVVGVTFVRCAGDSDGARTEGQHDR